MATRTRGEPVCAPRSKRKATLNVFLSGARARACVCNVNNGKRRRRAAREREGDSRLFLFALPSGEKRVRCHNTATARRTRAPRLPCMHGNYRERAIPDPLHLSAISQRRKYRFSCYFVYFVSTLCNELSSRSAVSALTAKYTFSSAADTRVRESAGMYYVLL